MRHPASRAYIERWFLSPADLAIRAGISADEVKALIAVHAAPGPSYVATHGGWWHALSDDPRPEMGEAWYSPAAPYWLRRAQLAMRGGADRAEAARRNRAEFARQFLAALTSEPLAKIAYADVFADGMPDPARAATQAEAEWADWINGGYGVCLLSFTGATCVAKESLGHFLRRTDPDGSNDAALLDLVERLAAMMLPFAPDQRPGGTPGFTVDRLLAAMELGEEQPFRGLPA